MTSFAANDEPVPPFIHVPQELAFHGTRISLSKPGVERMPGFFGRRLWSTDYFILLPNRIEYDIPKHLYHALPKASTELFKLAAERFSELLDQGEEGEIAWGLIRYASENFRILHHAHRLRRLLRWSFRLGITAGVLAIITILWNASFSWCPWTSL